MDEPLINMPPVNTKNEISYNNKELKNLKISLQSEYVFAKMNSQITISKSIFQLLKLMRKLILVQLLMHIIY